MEPVAATNHPIAIRPAGAIHHDLSSLLRDGRVLAGEVLKTLNGGGLLIGIGRHRVPAQTHLKLDPGHHFLFQVERNGDQFLLRILGGGGESDLVRFLRQVIGDDRPIGELLSELAARVRAELERPGSNLEGLRRILAGLEGHVFRPGDGGAELGALLERAGWKYEAALLAAALRGGDPAAVAALSNDLKAELLRVLAELHDGPLREAVARALAGIEAEQLLNLARHHTGEPLVFSFPLPDGGAWTTAQLLVYPRGEHEQDGDAEWSEEDGVQRLVLGVSFTHTGPVRADLMLTDELLTARVLVTRPELAQRLQADFPALAERIPAGGRAVKLLAGVGEAEDVEVRSNPLDMQLFRDNHLMDVSG